MSCCCCFSKLIQLFIIYGYPGYKVLKTAKEGKLEKLWILYFLIIGIFSVLEGTLLFPIIFILGKICKRIYPTLKVLFHFWLYSIPCDKERTKTTVPPLTRSLHI